MAPLLGFSEDMQVKSQSLKTFLFHQLYRHPRVMQTTGQARQVVTELFAAYRARPQEITDRFGERLAAARAAPDGESAVARVVADYIAGMTDRFAAREHERLTGARLL